MNLKLITAPTAEPVTLDEVKVMARIDHDTEDDILKNWIKAGRQMAEDFQRRSYMPQTWEMIFDEFPTLPLFIPRAPVLSVSSVTYYDYQNTAATVTIADTLVVDTDSEPGRIDYAYGESWPSVTLRPMAAVKIRFISGYGATNAAALLAIPAVVKDAIMLYCSFRNENRTAEVDAVPGTFYDLLRSERLFSC